MKYLSLFSGIGGFDLGFDRAGLTCIDQCENDRHAAAVLSYHWPTIERVDNVKSITAATFNVFPDVICGGFPCQDVSIAGRRKGLDGGRSGLWFEYYRIIKEIKPAWVIVENVPGLFSSNGGRDFAVIIQGMAQLGYMGIWKTFDSQYFGVAQRRRRLFIIANHDKQCLTEVLFESEGVQGNPTAGRKTGQGLTAEIAPCLASSGRGIERAGQSRGQDPVIACYGGHRKQGPLDIAPILNACKSSFGRQDFETEPFITQITHTLKAEGFDASEDGTGRGTPIIPFNGVRRLTPVECERLQGFPDNWTLNGRRPDGTIFQQSDSQRYKQLGNAVTVTVAEYIGKMILNHY